jgi:hypothetical protein
MGDAYDEDFVQEIDDLLEQVDSTRGLLISTDFEPPLQLSYDSCGDSVKGRSSCPDSR